MARHLFRNRMGDLAEIPEVARLRTESMDMLSTKSESLLDRMQSPEVRKGMKAAFNADPTRLGKAAVQAAKRKR